ncbi:MAG: hypothetical protein JWM57_3719, partial [Phycisphaerales bacterium]|nr:hypothetical protein [Phycisphaerales bacterium]
MLISLSKTFLAAVATAGVLALSSLASAEAVVTKLSGSPGHWELLRNGQPYFIKGVGGSASMELLKQLGGNSVRTWGADDLGRQLDEAQRLGLTVAVGIWLPHEDKRFNYDNADQVAQQVEKARTAILKYKDHPAVLMWGIGNEMEGPAGNKAVIWAAVNNIAVMAKQLDPNHPTMTVIAEIGADGVKAKNIHQLCPAIDIIGINSYGGAPSIPTRYQAAGGTKPYVLTEFGPIGFWEGGHTSYKAPIEPNSSEKVKMYDAAYTKAIDGNKGTCLGGYAFLWGNKQETTTTWFGMLLPDGSLTPAVSVISSHWTGQSPAVQPPQITNIKLAEGDQRQPGDTVHASVTATSSQSAPLTFEWQLHAETEVHGEGGSYEPPTKQFNDVTAGLTGNEATLTLPQKPGVYRLYVFARDASHYVATANVPILVGPAPAAKPKGRDGQASGLKKPVVLLADDASPSGYIPSGWMGNAGAIALNPAFKTNPHTGVTCMECKYTAADQFGGVVWQSPANNWGDQAGGRNLTGAARLRFWARGVSGGEKVEFKFGVLQGDQKFKDSAGGDIAVTLTKDWKQYEIDLAGKDLSQ